MAIQYSIPQILQKAGLIAYAPGVGVAINNLLAAKGKIQYQQALEEATKVINGYDNITVLNEGDIDRKKGSFFEGVALYLPMTLKETENDQNPIFLESAIVSLNRPRNIVVTELQGRDSSVKEFINNGDWSISVNGIIATKGLGYPIDEIDDLNKALAAKRTHQIEHEVMNRLGIQELVITDYAFPASEFENIQSYSFNAISEVPIELLIDE